MMTNHKNFLLAGFLFIALLASITVLVQQENNRIDKQTSMSRVPEITQTYQDDTKENRLPENSPPDSLTVAEPVLNWTKVCKNFSGGYQVKYPNEWSVVFGDIMEGFKTVKDCNVPEFTKRWSNELVFSSYSSDDEIKRNTPKGIHIYVISKEHAQQDVVWTDDTFLDSNPKKYKELIIDGEKALWMGVWVFHHNNKQYEISIDDNVPENLVTEFISTFKFL